MSGIYRGPGSSVAAETVNLEGDKGDITVSNAGETWTIDSNAVTFSKIQNVATDTLLGRSTASTGNVETITCTAAGRALLDDADAAAQRTTLGITELAAQDPANVDITGGSIVGITDLAVADGGTGASSASDARTNLGLVIGANVLAYDANLQSFVTTFTLPTADSTSGFYLKTDGAGNLGFQAPGGLADGDYGDITVSGGGAVWSIDADTITTTELANNAVETANITDLNVTTGKLADLAVTTAKLNDLAVTAGKLASNAVTTAKLADSAFGPVMINGYITASVASSALTIAVKTNAGTDPSSSDPVLVLFRNSTVSNGSWSVVSITAATSVVVSNGSSLGTTASVLAKLNVLLLNNAGTAELAVCNAYGYNDLDEGNVISTTAEGGAGAADSASVIYSTTARSNVAFRYVGYLDVTPGASFAWSSAPTVIANAHGSSANNMAGMLTQVQAVSGAASYTFSIPAWAKKATCTFTGISTNGTGTIAFRLGDAGGVENTGYNGTVSSFNLSAIATANLSSAFNLTIGAVAAASYDGELELNLHNPYTNTWVAKGGLSRTDGTTGFFMRGSKATSAKATTLELSTSDTFDGGVGEWAVLFE
jgi:hypothetical protein